MKSSSLLPAVAALSLAACTPAWTGSGSGPAVTPAPQMAARPATPTSFRIVESATGHTVSFALMMSRASTADVVFFGERHDDPETHFLEFAVLEALGQRHSRVILSLEMFERDVQDDLDRYLAGGLSEAEFLATSRPWPRYATDYRGMVQLARARGWRVIAANIPRPVASAISRRGMRALDTLTTMERTHAAASLSCTNETAYYRRFAAEMGGHSGAAAMSATDSVAAKATLLRFYEAQCSKDETMAESIAREMLAAGRGIPVLHVNGAFHSDFGQGTAERVRRRMPDLRSLVITAVPVNDPATAVLGEHAAKADYVIFTRAPKK